MKLLTRKLGSQGFNHLLIPIVVVIFVGGIGTYLIVNSNAQEIFPCFRRSTLFQEGDTGRCVEDIQKIVQYNARATTNKSFYVYASRSTALASDFVDGAYGPNTAGEVKNIQHAYSRQNG